MKATLTFSLPDEEAEYRAAVEGMAARNLLWQIDQECRSTLKHGDPSEETRAALESLRRLIAESDVRLD